MYFIGVMKLPVKIEIDYEAEANTFFSIQMARYLGSRPSGRFSGLPEYDAVMDMIKDAWIELRASGILNSLSPHGRESVYYTTIICFPTFVADSGLNCIPVDFVAKKRIGGDIIAVPPAQND